MGWSKFMRISCQPDFKFGRGAAARVFPSLRGPQYKTDTFYVLWKMKWPRTYLYPHAINFFRRSQFKLIHSQLKICTLGCLWTLHHIPTYSHKSHIIIWSKHSKSQLNAKYQAKTQHFKSNTQAACISLSRPPSNSLLSGFLFHWAATLVWIQLIQF